MKALYIELAAAWAGIAAFNFLLLYANGSVWSLVGGVLSLLNAALKVYCAGKEG